MAYTDIRIGLQFGVLYSKRHNTLYTDDYKSIAA